VESIALIVGHSSKLAHLGEGYVIAGRVEDAAPVSERAFAIAREHGQQADRAIAVRLRGDIAAGRGSAADARDLYGQAASLAEALGMRPLAARSRLSLGAVLRRSGDVAAYPILEEARASFRTLRMSFWFAAAEKELGAGLG